LASVPTPTDGNVSARRDRQSADRISEMIPHRQQVHELADHLQLAAGRRSHEQLGGDGRDRLAMVRGVTPWRQAGSDVLRTSRRAASRAMTFSPLER
jgi:hypothetical protein